MSRYNEKRNAQAIKDLDKELDGGYGQENFEKNASKDARGAAMGEGESELFEKKLSKEERKAAKKLERDAKRKAKGEKGMSKNLSSDDMKKLAEKEAKEDRHEAMLEKLSQDEIVVTYESRKGKLDPNARNINVSGVTVSFHGKPLIEETNLVINYGNRYGFIGPNGSGKSTVMKAIAARAIPIPENLDIYFLDCEYPARDDITALEAVMESNNEIQL